MNSAVMASYLPWYLMELQLEHDYLSNWQAHTVFFLPKYLSWYLVCSVFGSAWCSFPQSQFQDFPKRGCMSEELPHRFETGFAGWGMLNCCHRWELRATIVIVLHGCTSSCVVNDIKSISNGHGEEAFKKRFANCMVIPICWHFDPHPFLAMNHCAQQ